MKGPGTVAHASFLRSGDLAERATKLVGKEQRVVTEATVSVTHLENPPLDFATLDDLVRRVHIRRSTHVARPPIGHPGECLEKQAIVLIVKRLPSQVVATAPALAPHPGRASKRIHSQAGVIGDRWDSGACEKVPRLRQGILLERLKSLKLVFGRIGSESRILEVDWTQAGSLE